MYFIRNSPRGQAKVLEIVQVAKHGIYAIGQDLSWLNDARFSESIEVNSHRIKGELTVEFIVTDWKFFTDLRSESTKGIAQKLRADVRLNPHSSIRYLSCDDGSKFIVAFGGCYSCELYPETTYGLYIEDPKVGRWLLDRFRNLFGNAYATITGRSFTVIDRAILFLRRNWEQTVVGVALGIAFMVLGMILT